ncbi:hypothetical protein [Mucisphaera calidilacus]|uniref:Uncharacterized protein n=1 Tax=Mucisphaera calidilacus TaxID=2527982 RepID=A0A518BYC1_9BACT|nr:hypothetical protein [Mucisphaera calidilacus]QDU71979.1 hypothetical protein Pan265_18380 [Mucisphaera calidilacus]
MGRRTLGCLLAVNAMLLFGIAFTSFIPQPQPALAQNLGRGNYLMIAGDATGRSSQAALYIVNLSNSRVISGFFNASTNRFEFIAARDLTRDLAEAEAQRSRRTR